MKRAVILIALFLALAAPAAAQERASFGARIGVNFANLNFDPDDNEDTKNRTGLVAGVFATVPVSGRFAFQPEVLFSSQGAKGEDDELDGEGQIKLNYINVPLLASINLASGDNPVAFLIGPQIGFRTSAEIEFDGEEEDLDDETESTDFGIVAGIAASIRNFVVDVRYTHGLRNINDIEDDDQKVRNRVFSVSVGVRFR